MFPKAPTEDEIAFITRAAEVQRANCALPWLWDSGLFPHFILRGDRTLEGSLNGFKKAAQKFGAVLMSNQCEQQWNSSVIAEEPDKIGATWQSRWGMVAI